MMTEKQKRFCLEYAKCGNATEAAIVAGYAEKYAGQNADKLLKNTKIQDRLKELVEQLESEKIADATEVMEYLTSVLRGESKSEVVVIMKNEFGNSQIVRFQKHPDEKEKLKAAELLGKRYGLFKGDVTAPMKEVIIINDLIS